MVVRGLGPSPALVTQGLGPFSGSAEIETTVTGGGVFDETFNIKLRRFRDDIDLLDIVMMLTRVDK